MNSAHTIADIFPQRESGAYRPLRLVRERLAEENEQHSLI